MVELFTSEGCSSCPAADWLLGKISASAQERRNRMYPLAFHVDYWDHLGWQDPFSAAAFTDRQQRYAGALKLASLSTPQMIINGTDAFVGSNWLRARSGLTRAMKTPGRVPVAIRFAACARQRLQVAYTASAVPTGAVLNVACVERGLVNRVTAGENRGRTLRLENVVRAFQTVLLEDSTGVVTLTIPETVRWPHAAVVGYVQDPATMIILGADGFDMPAGGHSPPNGSGERNPPDH